ncbi:hypothetical protein CRYUN_Cryun08bG0110300 [Craigia yunnanensis]
MGKRFLHFRGNVSVGDRPRRNFGEVGCHSSGRLETGAVRRRLSGEVVFRSNSGDRKCGVGGYGSDGKGTWLENKLGRIGPRMRACWEVKDIGLGVRIWVVVKGNGLEKVFGFGKELSLMGLDLQELGCVAVGLKLTDHNVGSSYYFKGNYSTIFPRSSSSQAIQALISRPTRSPILCPFIFFYTQTQLSDSSSYSAHISAQLKRSLSETLNQIYPLSGRPRDNLCIDSYEEGVPYIEARVNCCLSDYLQHAEIEELNQLLPSEPFCYHQTQLRHY